MDDNEKKIAKGRCHLKMKAIQKFGEGNPDAELFKIPLGHYIVWYYNR